MKQSLALLLAVSVLAPQVHAADAAPDVIRFDISRFEVHGNTLLPAAEVARVLAPFRGQNRDFSHVEQALEALTGAYQAAGYSVVAVTLPEQELERGVVVLEVQQVKLGRVQVRGNRFVDAANVRRALPPLREGETPNVTAISAALKLANEQPARKITMKLQSAEQEGAVDAMLDVADEKQWKAMLNADNSGSGATGKTHVGAVLQHANLFGRDHVASLQFTTSAEEPGRVKVYGAGYHIPLYTLGDALDLYASYSNIDSGTVTAGAFNLAVSGKGAVYGMRYTQRLRSGAGGREDRLLYGIDYKDFRNSVLLLGQELGNDVTLHPLSVGYLGSWDGPGGDAGLSLTLLHNIPGGQRGNQEAFNRARSGASAAYTALRAGASISRIFAGEWQWRAIANAQYSSNALVPGEQFGAGGAGSVRGFGERDVAGDSGLGLNLEVYTPNLCASGEWQCRLLAFHDRATVRRNHALAGELGSTSLASAGLGLRLMLSSQANLQLDYGRVMQAGATGRGDSGRLHVRFGLAY